jgi:sugar (pentulose or hexulose) kinase
VWSNVDAACAQTITTSDRVIPNEKTVALYESLYEQYQRLYPTLKPTFHALST